MSSKVTLILVISILTAGIFIVSNKYSAPANKITPLQSVKSIDHSVLQANTANTPPLSFNDSLFNGLSEINSTVSLPDNGAISNKSIVENSGNPSLTCVGSCSADHIRIKSREAVRIAGNGTVNISNSWLEAQGVGDDHADVIQAYAPGSHGTLNITNSTLRAYDTAATAGLFIADNYTGTINLENVIFWGGPYGLRVHPDVGGDNTLSLKNVYFVNPFAYSPILLTDVGGHVNHITLWENIRYATIVNGALVPGDLIPCPLTNCQNSTPSPAPSSPSPQASQVVPTSKLITPTLYCLGGCSAITPTPSAAIPVVSSPPAASSPLPTAKQPAIPSSVSSSPVKIPPLSSGKNSKGLLQFIIEFIKLIIETIIKIITGSANTQS